MEGAWSARRATYRVVYRIDDVAHTVTIEMIRHRRSAYR
jgi:mRNA interferase RelE/StbE